MSSTLLTPIPTDAFTEHLHDCLDCTVRLDGSGNVCPEGQRAMDSVDWPTVSAARDAWMNNRAGTESGRLLDQLIGFRRGPA